MRHFAIYNLKWPERVGGVTQTALDFENNSTREWAKRTASALLAAQDRKSMASTSSRPAKRRRDADEDADPAPPVKKAKVGTGRPRGRPPKNKVGMSKQARAMLTAMPASPSSSGSGSGRRSGRARMPSLKMRESEPPKGRIGTRSQAPLSSASVGTQSSSLTSAASEAQAREPTPEVVEQEQEQSAGAGADADGVQPPSSPSKPPTPKSLAVAAQPRESNGRFGKKASTNGRYMRKNFTAKSGSRRMARAHRALQAKLAQAKVEATEEKIALYAALEIQTPVRADDSEVSHSVDVQMEFELQEDEMDEDEDEDMRENKRPLLIKEDEDLDENTLPSLSFRQTLSGGSKVGGGLLSRPNPMTFARRKWTSADDSTDFKAPEIPSLQRVRSSSTDDDGDLPVTPDDGVEPPVVVVDSLRLEKLAKERERNVSDVEMVEDEQDEDAEYSTPPVPYIRPAWPSSSFGGSLTSRPSPFNLAKRRWGPGPSNLSSGASKSSVRSARPARAEREADFGDATENASRELEDDEEWSGGESVSCCALVISTSGC